MKTDTSPRPAPHSSDECGEGDVVAASGSEMVPPHPGPLPRGGEGVNYHEAPLVGELFPNLPPASPGRQPVLKLFCTRANYGASVKQRWHGWALRDALDNWEEFEEHRAVFAAWCEHYRRDPQMYVGAKAHNPEGTLTSMVWVMQAAIEPDKSCCYPCLDFEEHFQTVFIRRGLMMYLTLLLQEAESTSPRPAPHLASEAKRGEGEVVSAPVPL